VNIDVFLVAVTINKLFSKTVLTDWANNGQGSCSVWGRGRNFEVWNSS